MTGEQGTLCTRCGASVAAGAYFCARCGTSIPIGSGDAGATVASASHALLDALRQATLGAYEVLAEVGHGGGGAHEPPPHPPPPPPPAGQAAGGPPPPPPGGRS